ncbi:hypothetical protein GALL_491290 [mine drainage metagenome]|uniref:Uncharacterized protein n=1 Tax=mine drainage metagenome TaxID=410659 RepID=A0A1J5PND3_9ZZZZ
MLSTPTHTGMTNTTSTAMILLMNRVARSRTPMCTSMTG